MPQLTGLENLGNVLKAVTEAQAGFLKGAGDGDYEATTSAALTFGFVAGLDFAMAQTESLRNCPAGLGCARIFGEPRPG